MSEGLHSSLTMYSGHSFTSCGRDVDGGNFIRIGDVGTRSTVVGADGFRLASGQKLFDTCLENHKGNSALSTAPSSRSTKPVKVPSEDLRIKPLDSPKAGTTQSSLRPLMNADTSWLSSSFPGSALRQQHKPSTEPHRVFCARAEQPRQAGSCVRLINEPRTVPRCCGCWRGAGRMWRSSVVNRVYLMVWCRWWLRCALGGDLSRCRRWPPGDELHQRGGCRRRGG